MTFKLGLTGSIGMGKSTTAQMFVEEGCALWDADAAVHRLYAKGGAAVAPMEKAIPGVMRDGAISRDILRVKISEDPALLKTIERIVHPLVGVDRQSFIDAATSDILVFDIPLLFETGGDARMDAVACVSISSEDQEARVLARGTMTKDQFETIRAKQMPNEEKCRRSDYVIVTDSLDHAKQQVSQVCADIRAQQNA
ncbi:MAG: dephospho-CoA kinase [Rhodobacteraceae bacterium]|nr:dephospho-CoA kinase [Paracoccaceae bacterium]